MVNNFLHETTVDFIKCLLHFKLTFDTANHLTESQRGNWREFEATQHVTGYPIKGCGLILNPKALADWSLNEETILNLEEDLAPEQTGSEIGLFPLTSVSIVYIYSLLEDYGNAICDHVNPNYRKERQAWHHGVYADCNLKERVATEKAINNFCKPFKFAPSNINTGAITALVRIKKERNEIVHKLNSSHEFELMFRCVVMITCSIYSQLPGAEQELKIYPWQDYHDRYKP